MNAVIVRRPDGAALAKGTAEAYSRDPARAAVFTSGYALTEALEGLMNSPNAPFTVQDFETWKQCSRGSQ